MISPWFSDALAVLTADNFHLTNHRIRAIMALRQRENLDTRIAIEAIDQAMPAALTMHADFVLARLTEANRRTQQLFRRMPTLLCHPETFQELFATSERKDQ